MAQWDAKDKTFLITGGASGLGAQYAKGFLDEGAKNVAIVDIAEEAGKATAERLNKVYGNKVVFFKCDVSKEEDIQNTFDAVVAQFKQIDVIINNAGIMSDAPNLWRISCDVNWQGVVSFTLKGVKHMRKDHGGAGGTIVNISSIAAITRNPFLPSYHGSKMAVLHFGQSLAMEPFYENTGIRVFTMCPGATDTPLLHNLESRAWDPKLGKTLAEYCETDLTCQKPEAAVAAVVQMVKTGAPGTIWITIDGKPAQDITPVINNAFQDFEKVAYGLKIIAIVDIAEKAGKATVERLNKAYGNKAVFFKCDVSKEEDIQNTFDAVVAQFKQIDVIINNAGIMFDAPNMWRTSCDVNWQGLVSFTMKGVKHMRKDEGGAGGTIVNISSTGALVKVPFLPTYCGSKMAVLHFSQCLAMEPFYENTGIRILTLCPGLTDTPLLHNLESRSYDPNLGKVLAGYCEASKYQKMESAVAALVEIVKTGAPGTIWLSVLDKPVKNITSVINNVFKEFEKELS